MQRPEAFSINWISETAVEEGSGYKPGEPVPVHTILKRNVSQDITYGPWKNIFLRLLFRFDRCAWFSRGRRDHRDLFPAAQAMRGKLFAVHTEYVGLYWHFVDLVWIFLFPLCI